MNATLRAPPTALTRILLVDDDPSDKKLIVDLLDAVPAKRFQIDWARSLAEGREHLAKGRFDICLLDLQLPDGNGLEFLASADLLGLMAPIIVLTSFPSAELDQQALKLGAVAFLEKDKLDPTMFERVVRYAVHQQKIAAGIARQAFRDEPTDLVSKHLYRERLDRALAFARRRDRETAVMMIDLAFDHGGDEDRHLIESALHGIGRRLVSELRETDSVARLSEKRLGLLIEGMRGLDQTANVARKVLRLLRLPVDVDGHPIAFVPSIGVAIYPREGGEGDALMQKAEAAMRHAIAEGGGCCRFGSERFDREAREGMILDKAFKSAFERRELRLRFHPDIALTGGPNGLGSEVAWRHPDRGWLPFGPPLSETDDVMLIKGIVDWALASAAEQLLTWNSDKLALRRLSLALPFRYPPALAILKQAVLEQVSARNVATDQIEIDLPAALVMEDARLGGSDLSDLKTTGVRLALDGFGEGRFAVNDLRQHALDSVKLAPDLCRDLQGDGRHNATLHALINLGRNLGLNVTAKGARDQRQFAVLKHLGCDSVQLSTALPPMSADAARVWLGTTISPPMASEPTRPTPEILVPDKRPRGQGHITSLPPRAGE